MATDDTTRCELCGQDVTSQLLDAHMHSQHKVLGPSVEGNDTPIRCGVCGDRLNPQDLDAHMTKKHPGSTVDPLVAHPILHEIGVDVLFPSLRSASPRSASRLSASSRLRNAGDLVVAVFWVALALTIVGAIILGFIYANAYKTVHEFGPDSANVALGVGVAVGAFVTSTLWLLPLYALGHVVRGQADIVDAITSQRDTPPSVA